MAEILPKTAGLRLQWQVATKPADQLTGDEPEWADISGAQGQEYAFIAADAMQAWRWRLRADMTDGEPMLSDAIMLPPLAMPETAGLPAEAPDKQGGKTEALPLAIITMTADVPLEEITYGTAVTLTAEIQDACENMLLQWQYAPFDVEITGEVWQDVPGAAELTHSFVMDEGNANRLWWLLITLAEPVEPVEESEEDETSDELAIENETIAGSEPAAGASDAGEDVAEEAPEDALPTDTPVDGTDVAKAIPAVPSTDVPDDDAGTAEDALPMQY